MKKFNLANLSEHAKQQLLELEREKARRSLEPLRLYVPNDYQRPFHECMAKETLLIGGNRSGKTMSAMMELAWAATGTHPIKDKYPDGPLNIGIVGKGWRHIGLVIYPYLFKAGAFYVIKDEQTGLWRAYHPLNDKDRKGERKPAPPLIPQRMIKQQSWILKSAGAIQSCELHNGTNIWFFSSDAEPSQGFALDLLAIDEDLDNEQWVGEGLARLADRRGRFQWSAMPHSKCESLLTLSERADKAEEEGQGHIKKFTFTFLDNPYIDQEEKDRMVERWAALGEDVLRQRCSGEFVFDSYLVYPTFNMAAHGYDRSKFKNGLVPEDWTRIAAIDPGHAVCAVLFAAVPPDESMVLVYDELYLRGCTADILASNMHEKVAGHTFHAFIIDIHGAKLTELGTGKTPQQQYSEAFARLGIASTTTGNSFIPGSDNIQAGLQAVRMAMSIKGDGTTWLKVLRGACPNLERELRRYKKKTMNVGGQVIVTDEPSKKGDNHAADCLRYLIAYDPEYHKPPENVEKPWWWDMVKKRQREKNRSGSVYLAPQSYSFSFDA